MMESIILIFLVNFLGTRLDVFDLYKSSNMFLFLSHRESFGNVLVEAMNFALPLIGWNVVGVRELIKNTQNGYLCEFGDFDCIFNKLNNLDIKSEEYCKLSNNSYLESKKYSIEKSINEFLNILNKMDNRK